MTKSNSSFFKDAKWDPAERATPKKIKDRNRDTKQGKPAKVNSSKEKVKETVSYSGGQKRDADIDKK